MIGSYLETVSSYAQDIDNLILLIGVLVGFWFFLAEAVFFWLIVRFRDRGEGHKAEYIDGSNKKHKRWVTIPHALVLVCDVFIIWGAIRVWVDVKQTLPEPDSTVRIVAQQWAWTFQHPGPDNQLDTGDDIFISDELHVEVDKTYHFELVSKDVLHSFSVPVFRLKQDVIPGRVIKGWFKPIKDGIYDIQCAEMCGVGHGLMGASIHIHNPVAFKDWMTDVKAAATAPPPEAMNPDLKKFAADAEAARAAQPAGDDDASNP